MHSLKISVLLVVTLCLVLTFKTTKAGLVDALKHHDVKRSSSDSGSVSDSGSDESDSGSMSATSAPSTVSDSVSVSATSAPSTVSDSVSVSATSAASTVSDSVSVSATSAASNSSSLLIARFVRACERSDLILVCGKGQSIDILDGFYGRTLNDSVCPHRKTSDQNCRATSSLDILRNMCDGLTSCTLAASNRVFGDPCRGTYKYLEASYICV